LRCVVERGEAQFVEDDQIDPRQGFDDLAEVLSARPR